MTQLLLAITVGPVQEFIKSARKTRDLWFGSKLLSDISRAVARSVAESCGVEKLIFPAPEKLDDLNDECRNVANVILVVVPDDISADVRERVVEVARVAAQSAWLQKANTALKYVERKLGKNIDAVIRRDVWEQQVDDVLEFYAAWTPLTADYASSRQRVMSLLAARKQCRDFKATQGKPGLPKSSLDGARETVLQESIDLKFMQRLRLRKQEQLDCIGLVKRLATASAEDEPQFPSVSRVAAQPWLEGCLKRSSDRDFGDEFGVLQGHAAKLVGCGLLHDVATTDFPFEGTVVFRNRYREFAKELAEDVWKQEERHIVKLAGDAVLKLERLLGFEPDPYLAVLMADGDRVGATLSVLKHAAHHRTFSRALTQFADEAKRIVELFAGVLVYAGGDDVVAFLPVHRCVACAKALERAFAKIISDVLVELGLKLDEPPTLSAGIAIGHFMEPLEFLREYAEDAEKDAKKVDGKNALAIHVHTRGGAPIKRRARWDDKTGGKSLDERLHAWVDLLHTGQIPHRAAYQLRQLSGDFEHWAPSLKDERTAETDDAKALIEAMKSCRAEAIQKESLRVLSRKNAASGSSDGKEAIQKLLKGVRSAEDLREVADELLIARRIHLADRLSRDRTTARAPAELETQEAR